MIRLVQLGIDHPHAAAYRGTLRALRDRVEVVGFLARPGDTTTRPDGPFAEVPIYRALDDLLEATRPDAAQVMLRNDEMGAMLTRLAGDGVHLWVEKPVARRPADLLPARDLIRRKGLVFTAGYQSRCYPTTAFARLMAATTTVSALAATVGEMPVAVEDVAAVSLRFPSGWLASLNYGYLLPTREASPFGDDDEFPRCGLRGRRTAVPNRGGDRRPPGHRGRLRVGPHR